MKCPECIKEGKKSRVYPSISITTLKVPISYYDEDGNFVDCNTTITSYSCSNGHKWSDGNLDEVSVNSDE